MEELAAPTPDPPGLARRARPSPWEALIGSAQPPWDAIAIPSLVNFVIAAVAAVLFAGLAMASILRQSPVYQSTAVMLLDQPVQIALGNESTVVKLNLLRGKYTAILTTSAVMEPAAAKAGVPVADIAASQRPIFAAGALTIFPAVHAGDPDLAQRMAQATAEALAEYVANEQAATGLDPSAQLTLRIIQDAGSGVKVSPKPEKARQVGVVAGAAGLVVAYVGLQLGTAKRRLA